MNRQQRCMAWVLFFVASSISVFVEGKSSFFHPTQTAVLRLHRGGDLPQDPTSNVAIPEQEPPPAQAAYIQTALSPVGTAATTPNSSSKWANVRQRTIPAVLMLAGLYAWVKFLGTKGVIVLVAIFQVGMYSEATNVTDVSLSNLTKWWYYLTFWFNTSGRILLFEYFPKINDNSQAMAKIIADFTGYGMIAVSMCGLVLNLNSNPSAGAEAFGIALSNLGACVTALILLVGQSSFWLSTLLEFGFAWILFPALLVIINDTMAYVFGMAMGKRPLLKVISPKKTWEGFLGAAVSTLACALPLMRVCKLVEDGAEESVLHVASALIVAAFISIVSPFGGFLASVTKRANGKKDFGTLIPGHGGVVDRLDCQIMTAPFVYLYLKHFWKM